MGALNKVNVSSKEFMEEVARYECLYHRNSKDLKDKNRKANCWKKNRGEIGGEGGGFGDDFEA